VSSRFPTNRALLPHIPNLSLAMVNHIAENNSMLGDDSAKYDSQLSITRLPRELVVKDCLAGIAQTWDAVLVHN
jgi:hypothetical protein